MKSSRTARLYASIFACLIFFVPFLSKAQNPKTLEFFQASLFPAPTGPTVAPQVVTFRENTNNPTGNTSAVYTANGAPVTVTYNLSAQQYNTADWPSNTGAINPGVFFGGTLPTATGTDQYDNAPTFVTQGAFGGAGSTNFTSSSLNTGGPANGIESVTNNYAVAFLTSSTVLRNALATVPARHRMADLTITFSRPVDNPILHFGGLGGTAAGTNFSTEFNLISTGMTMTRLSGSTEFSVTATQINNSAALPNSACGSGGACGSVRFNGQNISSIVLRVFMRGVGGTWSAPLSAAGDGFTVGASTDSPVDLSIVKTASSLSPVIGDNITFNLTASNLGNNNATGVTVTDLIPAGYTFVSATPSIGTYNTGTGVWTIGNLVATTGTATLSIVAKVNPTGPYVNTATIVGNEDDPVPTNDVSTVTPVPILRTDLGITKTVNNPTPTVNSNVVFTLNAINNGLSAATGVSVTDVLPAGYTFVSNTAPTQGSFNSGTGVWTIGNMISTGTASMTITATVNPAGPYANTATIAGAQTDPIPGNNSSTVTPAPVPITDLTVLKTVNNSTPAVGSNVVFTLLATNNGPSPGTGINVSDLLPAGYTYVSSTPPAGTTYTPGTGVWSIGPLASGGTSTLTITATVNATGPYANTATITGIQNDPTPGNNTSTATPVPIPTTDRSIVKTVNNATPAVGSNVIFTLLATNNGPSNGTGITVTDLLPAGYTYVSSTPPAGTTYTPGTGVWNIGPLASGGTSTLTITATVNATGPYGNTATITGTQNDPTPGNNTSISTPVPTPTTDRSIAKTVDNATPAVGSNVIFTLVATNNGPSAGTGITVTDLLPAGYTYVSSTPPAGTTYTPGTGVWNIGPLASTGTATLTITATVNATGPYGNTATITGTENDPTPGNNTSISTPVPTPTTDRSIAKSVNNATPAVGSNVVFTLVATNNGPSAGTGITVTDLLPAGYTYVSSTPPAGTTYTPGTGVWNIGPLASTGTATLTITATVKATGPYGNTATITGTENDPTPGNNTSNSTPVPTPTTDRSIAKTVDNATPAVGSNVVFTLVATNNGPSNGTGITVTDLLPAGYTYVSSTPPAGTTYTPGTGVWNIGPLASAATATLTITATVNATGPYGNTATITGTENDPTPGNNTSISTPVPTPTTDRSIAKSVNNPTPAVGSNVVFTLVATNNGPSNGTGITVTDLLPAGYTYVSSTPPAGTTYTPGTGVWNIGPLASTGTATLTITATVNATGPYNNTATITGTENDPTPGNNTSISTPVPTPTTDRSIVKTVNNPTPAVGSNVIFTLVATNNGPSNGTGITVTDLLPAGYTYVSSTPPAGTTYNPGSGVWNIGPLASTGTSTLTITATVNATGPYANTATITGTENDPTPGNNISVSTPVPTPTTDRSIAKTVNNPTPAVGSNVVFTLVATNNGPSAGTGITVTDLLPAGYTYVSSTPPAGTTYTPGTGVWNIGPLASASTATLTITATVNATGPYGNTATITGTENDPTPGNNTSISTPVPTPTTDRSIAKTVDNPTPAVGSNVVFTLVATNNGLSNGTGITVSDLLPAGYTYVSSTPPAGTTYTPGTGLWNIGPLASGATSTLTITATVKATGPYGNTATINGTENDPIPGNNTSTSTPVPTPTTDRSIAKTVNNPTPAVGSNVVFTLVATNNGPSNGTGITVTDLLPAGYTYVSSTPPAGTTYTSGTGVWDIGPLANGATSTLTITATVNAAGPYANTATITGTENDPTPGNNTATSTPVPTATTNLSVAKTVNNSSPYVGNTVTFTLAATNAGPSNATAVVVNDLIPSGYTFISATPSQGTYNSGTGVWTIGSLINGANATMTVTATVNPTGVYTNTATISGAQNDPVPADNTSSITPTPVKVQVVKTGPATANTGTTVNYVLTVSNTGTGNAIAQTISDIVSPDLTGVSWIATAQGAASVSTGGTGTGPNVSVTGDIPAGGGNHIVINITATIPATSLAAAISNTATVTAPGSPTVSSNTVVTSLGKQADLNIQKTGPSNVVAGNNITYVLTITNAGPSNANNVSILDNLPAGINTPTWTASAQNGAVINGPAAGSGNLSLSANIPTGTASVTVTINGTVATNYVGANLINTATATPEPGVNDPTPASSTVTTTVSKIANVRITKSGPANIGAGQQITYTLRVVNDGPSDVSGVEIIDNITGPILTPTWTATVQNGATLSALAGAGNINLIGSIPSGVGVIEIVVTGQVDPGTANGVGFTNTATANIPAGNPVTDPDPGTNTSTVPTTVSNTPDLRVSKNGPATVNIGDPITYTIVITNAGAGNITNASIGDPVPSSVTVTAWNITGAGGATVTGTPGGSTNTINTSGDIPAGANPLTALTLTINGIVNVNATPTFVNTVTVVAGTTELSSVTTAVNQSTDIVIEKNGTQSVKAGLPVSYTIKLSNAGPNNATGLVINDIVPAEIQNINWSAVNFGTASISGPAGGSTNTIAVNADVPTGAANYILITVTGKMSPSTTLPSITNTATVTLPAGLTDFNMANNTSSVQTTITTETNLAVVKTVNQPAPSVGSNVVFTIVASNTGPSDGTGITVTDLLPTPGYTYVSSTPPAGTTYTPGTGVWNIGALANGANAALTITATVNATGPYANTATISGTENDPTPGNNTSTETPVPVPVSDRQIAKTVDNPTPAVGSNVVFTLVATNNGPSIGTGITVTDQLPAGYTYVSSTPPAGTTYDAATGIWTVGTLGINLSSTLTITATVNATGPYANTANITGTENDPTAANNTATSTPAPTPTTDRSLVKTVDNATPAVGSNVVFTLVATNNGPSDGTGITVTDLLPAGYTYVSSTPPAGTTYVPATGLWTIGPLANGISATLTITATVNATGPYANTASINGTENDPTPGNNTSTSTPVPTPTTDRSIVKSVDNTTPAVGSNVVFTLVATNNGPSDGTGITVSDLLPSGYTYVSSTPPAGTTYTPATGLWNIGPLANGATSTLTITATVKATGPYANTATINGTENDPTPGNNTSTSSPAPTPTTDRSLVKSVNNATPAVGSNVVFTLVATNNGPSDGTGITVSDLLPAGYTYVSSTPPPGTTYNAATGLWTIGALANGTNATLTITALVNATGPYANTASITGTENDPTSGNNTGTSTPIPTPTTDRSLVKSVDNASPAVGSNVVFTLIAKNEGPSDGTGITVTDLLPAGYTYVSSTPPAGTTYTPATGLWNIGPLANGGTSTLTITATVNASGPYANTANISGTENDPNSANNNSTSTPVPAATTDRSLAKSVDNATPAVGSNVVFTLIAKNEGPSIGTNITVTDLLPVGYTYVSSTPPAGTTYIPATGLWTIGTLASTATSTLTITATVNATGPYANTASITGTENDPTPGNNTATSTPVPIATTDRSLVKSVDNATPAVGSNVVFTLIAKNEGPSDGTGITVTDLLPAGYTYVSSTPPAGTTYIPATGLWTIGPLANGVSSTLTITATVNATGPYANTATINGTENDPTPGNNSSTSTPTPTPTTDRSLAKTVDNATPAVGSNVVFTLIAKNEGPSDGTGITVTDLLPAGYTYVSSTPPAGTTYIPATGLWTIGPLANGVSSTLTITATVNATGPYANTATINGTENDPTPGNNSSTSTPIPTPTTDRSLVKTVDNATPAVGSNVVFTLVATNNGPSNGTGITVTDLLPAGYSYVSSTPPAGTTYVPATGLWTIGPLANGVSATLTITATVNATGPYANTATITGTENDPTPGNNTSTSTPTPTPTTDRSLVKTVDNATPAVGSNVVFTLVATNNGPSNAAGITVTDLLPAGYTYVSSTPPAGTTYVPATGLWTIGPLANGVSATLTITATVNATGPYANTATINGTENDPTPGNNTSTSTPTPTPTTDRSLVKTVDNATPAVGSNVIFTLVATNNGPSNGTGITVTDLLPAGYTYVSSTPPAGTTYTPATGVWDIGTMTNASTATLTITATVNATGPYANTATINGTENDPTPGNNTSTSTPTPTPTTDRSLAKTVDNATPAVGSNVVFTLIATNNGPSNGTGITVTDLLPAGYTYVSSTPPAGTTYTPATGVWDIGTMTNASTATLTITATVNATGPYSNTASINGTENDPTPGNNTSTSTPTPTPTTDRSLAKTVDNATPAVGSNVVFTLVATNNGPSNGTGITVIDLLPAGYTYVSSTPPAGTTYTPATGVWDIGTMTNASTATLTITATVNATGPYANTASINGTENDPTPGNNTSTSTPTPTPTTDRSLVKTVDNTTPAVGSNVVFTLVATNNGPSNGTGITVIDLLPAGYTYVSSTPPAGTTYTPATGVWDIGTMTNASTATLTITATVNATGPYSNTASINGAENDPTPGNNTSTSTPTPTPTTDRSLVKTVDNATPAVGSNVVFTLIATNNGPSNGTGITVTDLLPAGYTYVSSTPPAGTTYTPATGVWDIGTMTNASTATLTITAMVNATGPYANTASITGTENDPTPGNNTSTSTPTPTPTTDRSLAKTVDNATPAVGSNVVFSLIATNNGLSNGTGITVTDLLPAGYTYVSSTPPAGTTYTPATGVWDIGTMTNASTATLTITATVNATGPYANTASINGTENDPTPGNNSSTSTPTPTPTTDRSLVKTVDNAAPAVGSNVVFTLVATNNGPSNGTGITVIDLLPAGYTYVSSTPAAGTTYTPATGLWNIGTMTSASTVTLTITARVNATGPYANTATITGAENDPTPGNNTSTSTPTPTPTTDRSLVKTVDNATPAVGSNVVFTLVATNNGPSNGTGITVTDLLPAGYTYISSTPPAGTTYTPATGVWNIGTMTNASTATLTITARVNATGPYANTASINGTENDPTPGNNSSTSTPTPTPTTDRSLVKTVDNAAPAVGSNVVFTLVATNNGPSNGTGITVTDLLPAGYTYVSSTPAAGTTYTPATGLWDIGTMTSASSVTLTITARVNATGPYANTATITGTENDPTPGNNTSTSTPLASPTSDRSLVKTVNNAAPAVGTNVVFTLVATNNGPSNGTGITVTDLLPSGYTYVSSTPPAGTTYTPATGVWNIGTLANGSSSTLTITARVKATGTYTNTASINGTENDPTPGNNTGTATTAPILTPGITLSKTGPASINAGSTISYVIVAGNNGPSDATNLAITDMVNTQISNVTWTAVSSGNATISSGATGTGNSVIVNGNITASPTDKITITITGTVSASFTGQLSNIAIATPSEPGIPPVVTPPAETTVTRVPALSLVKTGPSNLKSGDAINYVIDLTNTSVSDAKNLTLSDLVSSDIGNVEWTATATGAAKILSASSGTGGNISISADLPAGAANKVTVNIKGKVSKTFTGNLTNTARAKAAESGTTEISSNTVATTIDNADFIIPNIITPNGDGSNDLFKIKGLENYPGTQATIFNRWGNEVYRSENYLNDWNGSELNEGTYYYLILRKEKSGSTTAFKGWVFIKR